MRSEKGCAMILYAAIMRSDKVTRSHGSAKARNERSDVANEFRPHIWSVNKIGKVFGKEGCTNKSAKRSSCAPPENVSDF